MIKLFVVSFVVILLSVCFMCVRILLVKNGRFSSQHISQNKKMRQDGISCATSQHRNARRSVANAINVKEM